MVKGRPDFANDLQGIQDDVVKDVGNILELAQAARRDSSAEPAVPDNIKHDAPSRSRKKSNPIRASIEDQPLTLMNVTTRLSHQTNELLTEAALRQRLKKVSPASRQDIMEVAIQEWCQRNGYSS